MNLCLSLEAVIDINFRHTNNFGKVRDENVIVSSLARPLHTFDGRELFPTVVQKAAVLLDGLALTQGFFDGNKRTAWIACVTYLRAHGLRLRAAADEYAADTVLDLVEHHIEVVDVQEWLLNQLDEH